MMNLVGLWIDHRKAVIVTLSETGESVTKIESQAEHLEYRGPSRPKTAYSAQYSQGDDQLDKQFLVHLNKYYDQVMSHLRGAVSILIFGPGEAKSELKKRLAREKGFTRDVLVETADRMTDRQIVARARRHFLPPAAAKTPPPG
jgi:hypothetical protein